MVYRVILFGCCALFACSGAPHPSKSRRGPWTFSAAKTAAAKSIFYDHRVTFYCDCPYDQNNRIQPKRCGYKPRLNAIRGARVEWEHIVPAAAFGQHRACWKGCDGQDGRKCCRAKDQQFREMEADLHNLVPSVGELNGDRSDRPYGEVMGEPREYGKCDFEIDFVLDVVEPAKKIRGNIARVYLYMYRTYPGGLPLTAKQIKMFRAWDRADPIDRWERTRWARVEQVQAR